MMKPMFRQRVLLPRASRMRLKAQSGFTLIELVVVVAIVALLAGTLLKRVWFYQEQAEKAAMEQVAGAVQTALVLEYGNLLTRGREAEVKSLVTENPTRWLMQKPQNYAGEFYGLSPDAIAGGNWAFDLKTRELVYVPYRSEFLQPGKDGQKWVRYRVHLDYEALPGSRRTNERQLAGVLFDPVEPYQWLVRGEK